MNNQTHVGSTEASFMLGISDARVRRLLSQGRIKGATKQGRVWMIPLYKGMPVVTAGRRGPKGTWYKRPRQVETCVLVNRQTIASNAKNNQNEPPIVVKLGKHSHQCHQLDIKGPCRLVYTPQGLGPCGARLWIEAAAQVPMVRRSF
ncbi:MAG: helix-turn-helix domain-containing protein [Symploca sp. SIO2E6]|nr:helix-turn-helix domain-containing protein [Symploca sp. SIO2E6]